jgi:hypothetical protein
MGLWTKLVKCSDCKRSTNHKIEARYVCEEDEELGPDTWVKMKHEYQIVQCAGCDRVSFLHIQHFDEPVTLQYPTPVQQELEGRLLEDREQYKLPFEICNLYQEVKTTFQHEAYLLAGVGLRTLVEAICEDQKIAGGNLKDRIPKLRAAGLITDRDLPVLDKLRIIGNKSVHKIETTEEEILKNALMIITHILRNVYILPDLASKIKL